LMIGAVISVPNVPELQCAPAGPLSNQMTALAQTEVLIVDDDVQTRELVSQVCSNHYRIEFPDTFIHHESGTLYR